MDPSCHECSGFCTMGRRNRKKKDCLMIIGEESFQEAIEQYKNNLEIKEGTKNASIVEAMGYMKWPRLKDTIKYAQLMKYKKLGIAFCIGLLEEAKRTGELLEKYGFTVCSVCCKAGGLKKTEIGIPEEYTMVAKTGYPIGFTTCNPVVQALFLNKAKTEMNIIIGLCVGHDITFTSLSKAPVTTLIAKDRSYPHNPAATVYGSHYSKAFWVEDLKNERKKQT
ncbi:MAG: DUF1847 domain-containing protein [Promethearchaeota archaeon]